jgi:anhydro-N-acetylmuramic acid kinase
MFVIGLISGTSVDGIDTVLVNITGKLEDIKFELIAGKTYPYPPELREQILNVCAGKPLSMQELAMLDDAIALNFAQSALKIQQGHPQAELIGSHGQTVFHRPPQIGDSTNLGYSLQLGRGSLIAHLTKITTISNFRVADIAAGGQGAPLVPKVDAYLLSDRSKSRCVQNIGGIGNVTYLPPRNHPNWENGVYGWDTGPGNSLIDIAVKHLSDGKLTYDQDGNWAASGKICQPLVIKWLKHEYFSQKPPKSTGRELFGWDYFQQCLIDSKEYELNSADLLATLTELTATSIVDNYQRFLPKMPDEVLICGGGSYNLYLKKRLEILLENIPVFTTDEMGVSSKDKEAIAFAVLGYWRYLNITGNLPLVTGANRHQLLGEIAEHL